MRNKSIVHLNTVADLDFSKLASLEDMKVAAANIDMVHRLEEILMQWYKQIEQVGKIKILLLLTGGQMSVNRNRVSPGIRSETIQCHYEHVYGLCSGSKI